MENSKKWGIQGKCDEDPLEMKGISTCPLCYCCLQETVWKNASASLVTVKDAVFKILWAVVQVLGRVGVAVH